MSATYLEERNAAFEHAKRQYFIRCAERAIKLVPLKQFQDTIRELKRYDAAPTAANRKRLEKIHQKLSRQGDQRVYGYYSAPGEVCHGLITALWWSANKTENIPSSITQNFAEARYCAMAACNAHVVLDEPHSPSTVLRAEYDEQSKILGQVMGEFYSKFKDSEEEYLASLSKKLQ